MSVFPDNITFARAVQPDAVLAKQVRVCAGAIVGVNAAPRASLFSFRQVPVRDLEELGAAVEEAAANGEIAVRARPKAARGRRAIYDHPDKGPAGLEIVPRRWAAFDWDVLPLDPICQEITPEEFSDDPAEFCNWTEADPLFDPDVGVRHALRRLPPVFRDVSCFFQVSASAGFRAGFRLRTWHMLDYPVTGAELKTWLKPAITRGLVDPVTLVEAQPHYLAVTVHGGSDPCPQRFGFVDLAKAEVPVPDLAGIASRQRERAAAQQSRTSHVDVGNPGRDRPLAEASIEACLAAIRAAKMRHTTYTTEAARARAICDKHGLNWAPVRAALIAAYESTLTAAEASERRCSSTLGVLTWLDGRAPG